MNRPRPRAWIVSALWLVAGLLVPRVAGFGSGWVERVYANKVFPNLMEILAAPARGVSWSVAQLLLGLFALVLLVNLLRAIERGLKKHSLRAVFAGLPRWIGLAATLVWGFHLSWGLNYARPPAATRYGLKPAATTVADLSRVTRQIAADVNYSYRLALKNGELAFGDSSSVGSRLLVSREAVAKALSDAHGLHNPRMARVDLPAPKFPHTLGEILTRLGISGIYIPFTGEATVNALLPEISIPFVMGHEMAHQRGIAREDEANFTAWLACRESGQAAARYSGALAAYNTFLGTLSEAAPDSARALNRGLLEAGPAADRRIIYAFWQRYEGPSMDLAEKVNDTYLKTNAQAEGTRSYGRMVDLILAQDAAGRWDPGW